MKEPARESWKFQERRGCRTLKVLCPELMNKAGIGARHQLVGAGLWSRAYLAGMGCANGMP